MNAPSDAITQAASMLFRHVTAEKAELYRAIMDVFAAAKRQFRLHLRPDEVRADANWAHGETPALEIVYRLSSGGEAVEAAMTAFVEAFARRAELQSGPSKTSCCAFPHSRSSPPKSRWTLALVSQRSARTLASRTAPQSGAQRDPSFAAAPRLVPRANSARSG